MSDIMPFSVVALIPLFLKTDLKSNLILAVSRKTDHDDFGLPGGKLEPGETPEEALVREVLEETGLTVQQFHLIYEDLDRVENGEPRPCRTYCVTRWEGDPVHREGALTKWVVPQRVLEPKCSFREYNQKLFDHIRLMEVIPPRNPISVICEEYKGGSLGGVDLLHKLADAGVHDDLCDLIRSLLNASSPYSRKEK